MLEHAEEQEPLAVAHVAVVLVGQALAVVHYPSYQKIVAELAVRLAVRLVEVLGYSHLAVVD